MVRKTTKLNADGYVKPPITYQDKLRQEEIMEKLIGYRQIDIDKISEIPLDTHVRYFSTNRGEPMFRLGGFIKNKTNSDKYIVLHNGDGGKSWSVQISDICAIYAKMTHKEELQDLRDTYEKRMEELREENTKLLEAIDILHGKIERRDLIIEKMKKKLKKKDI